MHNPKLKAMYHVVAILWATSLFAVSYVETSINEGVFIFFGMTIVLLVLFPLSSNKMMLGIELFPTVISIWSFIFMRAMAVRIYSKAYRFEEVYGIRLLSSDAPESVSVFNFYDHIHYLFILLGVVFCLVSIAYHWQRPEPEPMQIRFVNPFSFGRRFAYFSVGLLLVLLILFVSLSFNYSGVLTDWYALVLLISWFFPATFSGIANEFEKKNLKKHILGVFIILFAMVLHFVCIKNQKHLNFLWSSEFVVEDETLVLFQNLSPDLQAWIERLKTFSIFPEFRGDYLALIIPKEAPTIFSWKDFILVIPVGLYMLFMAYFSASQADNEKENRCEAANAQS